MKVVKNMRLETISAKDMDKLINNNDYVFIDLREKEDYEKRHFIGAINVDYDDIEKNNGMLPRNKTLILYCDRGGLSLMAAKKLSRMGYDVKSVIGGLNAYKGLNLE